MRKQAVCRPCWALAVLPAAPALAQTPEDALTAAWLQVCPARCRARSWRSAAPRSPPAARQPRRRRRRQLPRGNPRPGPQLHARARARENEQRVDISAKLSLFASADTGRLDRKTEPNEAAFDGNTDSITVGLDWAPHPQWLLGAGAQPRPGAAGLRRKQRLRARRYTGGSAT
jgi:hypothetical protein